MLTARLQGETLSSDDGPLLNPPHQRLRQHSIDVVVGACGRERGALSSHAISGSTPANAAWGSLASRTRRDRRCTIMTIIEDERGGGGEEL
jgi:hypothetical protein